MANRLLWRYGDTNPVIVPVDSGTVIEIGDMVWQDTDDAKPASDLTYQANLSQTQEYFIDSGFIGVAEQQSRSGDTDPIRVATSGTFEFDCASATFELGDFIGADDNAGGTALTDQQVIQTGHAANAVGRVAKRVSTAATLVYVRIRSALMGGGVDLTESST